MRFSCPNNKSWIYDWLVIGAILFGLYWVYNNQEKVKEYFARTEMREIP